jgi:predicted ArsR family transcriptional regulator
MRILGSLREFGPATASALADRLGESSGATSYHLRQLASFGFVEEERTLLEIEALIGQKIRRIMVPGYEVSSRDDLIKQLQERRRFGKRPQREDNAAAQAMAEAKLQGQRLKRLAAAKKPRQPK